MAVVGYTIFDYRVRKKSLVRWFNQSLNVCDKKKIGFIRNVG